MTHFVQPRLGPGLQYSRKPRYKGRLSFLGLGVGRGKGDFVTPGWPRLSKKTSVHTGYDRRPLFRRLLIPISQENTKCMATNAVSWKYSQIPLTRSSLSALRFHSLLSPSAPTSEPNWLANSISSPINLKIGADGRSRCSTHFRHILTR